MFEVNKMPKIKHSVQIHLSILSSNVLTGFAQVKQVEFHNNIFLVPETTVLPRHLAEVTHRY